MKSMKRYSPVRSRRRNPPLVLVILADLLLLGVGLVVFALFHHVLPRDIKASGELLPRPTTTASAPAVTTTGDPTDTATQETEPGGTTGSSSATTADLANTGAWGKKFAGKFTNGEIIKTADSDRSANINITVDQVRTGDVTYYVADIYLRDLQYFRTAFAGGSYARGYTDTVLDMAQENSAILAIAGDYYGIRDRGIVIRNGELYRDVLFDDVLLMNYDGSMQTLTRDQFSLDQVKANGAWQAWSFGPMLLDGGQPMTTFNSKDPANPRSAIGYYEPGHYCFVLVDGRQPGYSSGMTMKQLSQLFYDLGCKAAYNLDGGQSAVMTFLGQVADQPYRGGREISDIIYIAE